MAKVKEKGADDFIDPKVESKEHRKLSFKELMDGSILTRKALSNQLPFILYLSLLAIIYIGNRYHAEKIVRDTTTLQEEVMDLRAESITNASELMLISKQSEVIKLVYANKLDLESSIVPPIKIKQ